MPTGLAIISDALKELGVIAIGEQPSAAEADDGLDVLNDLLDSWRLEDLMIYSVRPLVFPLVAGQQSYTVGTGGNFNTPRPDRIEAVYIRSSNGTDYAAEITTNYQLYADVVSKGVTAQLPSLIYDDNGFPLRTLRMWPVPSDASFSAVLWAWVPLPSFPDLATDVTLPVGYSMALKSNLAVALAPRYGVTQTATIKAAALEAKNAIKRANTNPPLMTFDTDLPGMRRGYNILLG